MHRIVRKRTAALAALIACCVAAPATAADAAKTVDRIAAVVNDQAITTLDLDRALAARGVKKADEADPVLRREVLDRLIEEALFTQIVEEAAIEVTDEELSRAIANVLHQNRMSLPELQREIAMKGQSYEQYKAEVKNEIRRIKFVNQVIGPQVKISDQDLRDYFQRHQERFRGSHEAHLAMIVLPLEGLTTQQEFEAVRDEALDIVSRAQRGADFTKLAEKHSRGPNAASGGDLGMIALKDIPPPVAQAVKHMKIGDVSNPILVGSTIVIVKVISLPELSAEDFERMRDDIYSALYDERIEETLRGYLQRERQKAFIEVRTAAR